MCQRLEVNAAHAFWLETELHTTPRGAAGFSDPFPVVYPIIGWRDFQRFALVWILLGRSLDRLFYALRACNLSTQNSWVLVSLRRFTLDNYAGRTNDGHRFQPRY